MLRALILYTLGCSLLLHSVSSSPLASSGSSDERSQDGQNCSPCEQRQKLADSFGLTSIKGGVKKNGLYIGLFPSELLLLIGQLSHLVTFDTFDSIVCMC